MDLEVSCSFSYIIVVLGTRTLICTGFLTIFVSYVSATPAKALLKASMPRNVNLIYTFQISTGLVAQLLNSQVEPWQKAMDARVLCDTQDMRKKDIFCVFSSAFRFALSNANGSQLDLAVLKNGSCKNRFRLKE